MQGVATAAGWILMASALLGALYAAAAAVTVGRFFARLHPSLDEYPAITVLKPLHGAEPGLREALEGFFAQDYRGAVQIVFGVGAPEDAAAPVVKALIARHPERDALLVVGGRREGTNPKIANLTGMMPFAKHGVLVLSDSDIGVAPDYLRKVTAYLAQPETGAVTCCYIGKPLANIWSRLVAQAIDYHFLPSVILGTTLGLARPCFGSTIALKRSVLDRIGGFEAFRDRLADDYEIGNAVRQHGYDVALPPFAVTHTCTENSLGALFRHELRWQRTVRSVDPGGFAGSYITHAIPLALIGAALLGFSLPALGVVVIAILARLILKFRIDRALSRSGTGLWLFPLRDMLSFGVFVAAFFAGRVDWRGSRFRVRADGELARE
jgi:ceramide glucosyltransferase